MTRDEAFQTIKDNRLLTKRRWQVYETIYLKGPMTASEVHREMEKLEPGISNTCIRVRIAELGRMNVVTTTSKRDCTFSGRFSNVWETTENLPFRGEKTERHTCSQCKGKGYIEETQGRLV